MLFSQCTIETVDFANHSDIGGPSASSNKQHLVCGRALSSFLLVATPTAATKHDQKTRPGIVTSSAAVSLQLELKEKVFASVFLMRSWFVLIPSVIHEIPGRIPELKSQVRELFKLHVRGSRPISADPWVHELTD